MRTGALPQLAGGMFLTDGGLETTLIFHRHLDLPHFAAFTLLQDDAGVATLRRYYEAYLDIAAEVGTGFILESATWRASQDWATRLGISEERLAELNRAAVRLLRTLRTAYEDRVRPVVVSGCIGPRGDGYDPGAVMTSDAAEAYHRSQMLAFSQAGADMACAITMTNTPEAIGVARAATAAGLPVAVSFTVETDGRLPTGEPLGEAVEAVDAATSSAPAYYMINCAHPDHFAAVLDAGGAWTQRLCGLRANASRRSHQELDAAPDLDAGCPEDLGAEHAALLSRHRGIRVLGGCCGTDVRHVRAIARACVAATA